VIARALAAVAAVGTGLVVAAAPTGAATPHRCATSELRLQYIRSEGAAGTIFEKLRFVARRHSVRCSLRGYPTVALQGRSGDELAIHVSRMRAPKRTVIVAPGHFARFTVRHPSADPTTTQPCKTRVYGFGASPPGDTRALTARVGHHPKPLFCKRGARVTPVGRRY
jgi:hypothetical protein